MAISPMVGKHDQAQLRGLVNSEPTIAPIGSVASRPSTSTQASVSQAAGAVERKPVEQDQPGNQHAAPG